MPSRPTCPPVNGTNNQNAYYNIGDHLIDSTDIKSTTTLDSNALAMSALWYRQRLVAAIQAKLKKTGEKTRNRKYIQLMWHSPHRPNIVNNHNHLSLSQAYLLYTVYINVETSTDLGGHPGFA